jgi:hypothetical protein
VVWREGDKNTGGAGWGAAGPPKPASWDSLQLQRWGRRPKECPRGRVRAARLEPRHKRRGSDEPIKRAVVDSLRLKPRRKRRGSDQPNERAMLDSLPVKRWGARPKSVREGWSVQQR